MSLIGAGDVQGAIDELLESIRRDRNWNEAAARKELLNIFDALGANDDLVSAGRRKLSSILFS
jgi:putative thioredoxin